MWSTQTIFLSMWTTSKCFLMKNKEKSVKLKPEDMQLKVHWSQCRLPRKISEGFTLSQSSTYSHSSQLIPGEKLESLDMVLYKTDPWTSMKEVVKTWKKNTSWTKRSSLTFKIWVRKLFLVLKSSFPDNTLTLKNLAMKNQA